MTKNLLAATILAGVALGSLALAAQQPAPKAGAKHETPKETRSDPCVPESPKPKGTPAKKSTDSKKTTGSSTTGKQ